MTLRRASQWLVPWAAAALLLALGGCPKDPYDPQTWIDKLDDPAEMQQAVTELQRLKDPKAIEPLGKVWRKHNHASKVLRVIIELASHKEGTRPQAWEKAVPILMEAIESFDPGDQSSIDDASVSCDALGDAAQAGIRSSEVLQTLINAANKRMPKLSPGQRVRIAAVRALGSYGNEPRAVDTLITILGANPDEQPIKLNAAAANSLAETGSEKAIPNLLKALYAVPPIYQQVRTALTRVGKPAIPELIKVFQGEHTDLNAYAKEQNFANNCDKGEGPDSTCKAPGNLEFKAAALLGDLHAQEAVPALLAALKRPAKTSFYDPGTGAAGPPTHNAILDALRTIGDPSAADAILEYWRNPKTDDATRPLAIDVYSMLATDTKALPDLAKLFKDEEEEEGIRLSAALAYGRLVRNQSELAPLDEMIAHFKKPADENDAKAKAAKTDAEREGFEGKRDAYRGYQATFEENKLRAEVGIKCGSDPNCYAQFLDAPDIAVGKPGLPRVERALIELAKLGPAAKAVLPKLLAKADSTERIVRQGLLLAYGRIAPRPCPECAKRLGEVIDAQKDQTTLDYLTADTRIVLNYYEAK